MLKRATDMHVLLEVDLEFLLEQHRRDRIGRDVADHQRVAVGLRSRHFLDGEDAERARLVLDHELLAEAVFHLVAEQARRDVGAAARRIRHEDLHRLRRIFVLRQRRPADGERQRRQQQQCQSLHVSLHAFMCSSIRLQPRRFRQHGVVGDFLFDQRIEFGRRHRHRRDVEARQTARAGPGSATPSSSPGSACRRSGAASSPAGTARPRSRSRNSA